MGYDFTRPKYVEKTERITFDFTKPKGYVLEEQETMRESMPQYNMYEDKTAVLNQLLNAHEQKKTEQKRLDREGGIGEVRTPKADLTQGTSQGTISAYKPTFRDKAGGFFTEQLPETLEYTGAGIAKTLGISALTDKALQDAKLQPSVHDKYNYGLTMPVEKAEHIPEGVARGAVLAGDVIGVAGTIPAGGGIVKAAASPVSKAAKSIVNLRKATPTLGKKGIGIGVAATGYETIKGATDPEYADKRETFPSKMGAGLRVGTGEILTTAGGVAQWKGKDELSDTLTTKGEGIKAGFDEQERVPYSWQAWFNPDFYTANIAQTIPMTASLVPAMFVGWKTGSFGAAKMGLGPFGRIVVSSLAGTAASRPLESAFEAGDTYDQAYQKAKSSGATDEQAHVIGDNAANEVFQKNIALAGMDAAQLATAFMPASKLGKTAIGRSIANATKTSTGRAAITAGKIAFDMETERIEEGLQQAWQNQALGEDERNAIVQMLVNPTPEMQEAKAIGGFFGGVLGGAGAVNDVIKTRVAEQLPPEMKTQVAQAVENYVDQGMSEKDATDKALDELVETPEGKEIVSQTAQEVAAELETEIQRQMIEVPAAEKQPQAEPVADTIPTIYHVKTGEPLKLIDSSNPEFTVVENSEGKRVVVTAEELTDVAPETAPQAEPAALEPITPVFPETPAVAGQEIPQGPFTAPEKVESTNKPILSEEEIEALLRSVPEQAKQTQQEATGEGIRLPEGETVPPEVLKDYPELAKQPSPETKQEPTLATEFKVGETVYSKTGNPLKVLNIINNNTLRVENEQGNRMPVKVSEVARGKVETAEATVIPDINIGSTTTAKTERGTAVEAQYAVVDAGDVVASHTTDFAENKDYPQELQPRDRERVASKVQVTRMAQNIEPEFLGESPKASDGAPIVGPDMVVESGNGRIIALKIAYDNNKNDSAQRYRAWLLENAEKFGLTKEQVDKLDKPVLVRVRTTEIDRVQFAREANEQSVSAMSASEQATTDAKKLSPELLLRFSPGENGEILVSGNYGFIQDFMGEVIGPTEQARYVTSDGSISQEGVNRIRNAIFANAYGDASIVEKLAESTDNNIKNITNAMLMAAPKMVQLKAAIEAGNVFDLDITPEITEVAKRMTQLRESGKTLAQFLLEQDNSLFGTDLAPLVKDILEAFNRNKRSAKRISDIMQSYVDGVVMLGDPNQQSLFGEEPELPTKADILQDAIETIEGGGAHGAQTSLFADQSKGTGTVTEITERNVQGRTGSEAAGGNETKKGQTGVRFKAKAVRSEDDFAPPFYSQLQRIIGQKMPNKALPNQVLAIIKGGQVKQEEIKWSGIEDWLKERNGRITKQEALDYLKANDLQIEEVTQSGAKYVGWQLPGGENYQELLFTLPIPAKPELINFKTWLTRNNKYTTDEAMDKEFRSQGALFQQWDKENGMGAIAERKRKIYQSAHWNEGNVVAHVRINERTDENGGKMLFIEEIQSDWHQDGRRQGYESSDVSEERKGLELERDELIKKYNDYGNLIAARSKMTPEERSREKEITNRLVALVNTVPDAPFKTTWHEFVLKRMIRYAAENGYDRISWTTGEQQAERYDLSKQVNSIDVERILYPEQDAGWEVKAYREKGDYNPVIHQLVKDQTELSELIGKDLATKAVNDINEKITKGEQYEVSYSGLNLKIGGEGMKGFYDRMIPSWLNKYAKKWGARVGESRIGDEVVHSLPLTDAMKESVLYEGQPKFKRELTPEQELDMEVLKVVAQQRKFGPFTVNKVTMAPEALERPDFKAAGEIAEKLGLRLVPFKSKGGNRGAYYDGTLYINEGITDPLEYVFFHEVTHSMQEFQSQHYERLLDLSFEHLADAEGVNKHYMEQGYARADRPEEFAADVFAEAMSTPGFFARVAEKAPELVKPLLEAIDRLIANIRGAIDKNDTIIPYVRDWEVLRQRIRDEVAMPYFKDAMGEGQTGEVLGKQLQEPAAKAERVTENQQTSEEEAFFNAIDDVAIAGVNNPKQIANAKGLWEKLGVRSPYFQRWFKDGVVDEQGKPLVVYHFSPRDNVNELASDFISGESPFSHIGIFLTRDPNFQSAFSTRSDNAPHEFYVAGKLYDTRSATRKDVAEFLESPQGEEIARNAGMRINDADGSMYYDKEYAADKVWEEVQDSTLSEINEIAESPEFADWLGQKGYDGVDTGENLLVFSSTNVKSATANRGTFDATNPDIRFKAKKSDSTKFNLQDPDIQARMEGASGVPKESMREKMAELAQEIGRKTTREYEWLPRTGQFAEIRQALLSLSKQKGISADKTLRILDDVTKPLNEYEYSLFTYKVIFDDLVHEVEEGHLLPFGFTPETLEIEKAEVDKAAERIPKVKEAVEKRHKAWTEIKDNYIKACDDIGFNVENELRKENYYRHQVLEHANGKGVSGAGRKLRTPTNRGFLRKREGSTFDINTDYLQAEFEVMAQMQYDAEIAKVIKTVKQHYDIVSHLKREATRLNDKAMYDYFEQLIEQHKIEGADAGKLYRKLLNQKQAIAINRLEELAAKGELPIDPGGRFAGVVQELAYSHFMKKVKDEGIDIALNPEMPEAKFHKEFYAYLNWLAKGEEGQAKISALTVFKGMAEKQRQIKNTLGKNYLTWEDLIPEGYSTWQPREGNMFFMADSIPERVAEALYAGILEEVGITGEMLKKVLTVGQKFPELVIPNEVALTLEELHKDAKQEGAVARYYHAGIRGWKVWQLIFPKRYFKYNMRNFTGDIDAVIAGNHTALRGENLSKAWKDLWQAFFTKDGKMSPELEEWFNRGGFESLFQAQEISDVNRNRQFKHLMESKMKRTPIETLANAPKDLWLKYWDFARTTTDFREAFLRYACFLDYMKQVQSSPEGKPKNFGASNRDEIMGLHDFVDRAFKLTNELVGAYDEVSVTGQWLSTNLMPFWRWNEVNFVRYARLFKNAYQDGKLAETVGRKVATVPIRSAKVAMEIGKVFLKASLLMAIITAWNMLFFQDEEDDLPDDVKGRFHIIFGRDSEGNVIYFSRLGALQDFLDWAGLDATQQHIQNLLSGRRSFGEVAVDMVKSPVNKIFGSFGPQVTLPAGLLLRKNLFPDPLNARHIYNRTEYLFDSFGLKDEYREMTGKPTRGYGNSLTNVFVYKSDPGQVAYYDILDEKGGFRKEIGKGGGTGFWERDAKGEALHNLKLAIRYNDEAAATKYLNEYIILGGTSKGFEQSLRNMHPLYGLNEDEKELFLLQLDSKGRENFLKAMEYYENVIMP